MTVKIKICGIKDAAVLQAAAMAGAHYAGLNFCPASPRFIAPNAAASLARQAEKILLVGVFVDPDDAWLDEVTQNVPLQMIQLHGQEDPARTAFIRTRYNLPVMKALPVASRDDLRWAEDYQEAADYFLFDAKAGPGELTGGLGRSFDWTLLAKEKIAKPWFLAGGLTPDNVAGAVRIAKPFGVDAASGIEDRPGQKNIEKIKAFIAAARH